MNSKSVKEGGKHNMYSKSKRFIASFLAVLMAVCMLPADMLGGVGVVHAEGEIVATLTVKNASDETVGDPVTNTTYTIPYGNTGSLELTCGASQIYVLDNSDATAYAAVEPEGAVEMDTTNTTEPAKGDKYENPIPITANTTLKAFTIKEDGTDYKYDKVAELKYTMGLEATAAPTLGTITLITEEGADKDKSKAVLTVESGATVRYYDVTGIANDTTDADEKAKLEADAAKILTDGTEYSDTTGIVFEAAKTIRVAAQAAGKDPSAVAELTLTPVAVNPPAGVTVGTVEANPVPGAVTSGSTVSLTYKAGTDDVTTAKIYYTTDATKATTAASIVENGYEFSTPISITAATTIYAVATADNNDTAVYGSIATFAYTIDGGSNPNPPAGQKLNRRLNISTLSDGNITEESTKNGFTIMPGLAVGNMSGSSNTVGEINCTKRVQLARLDTDGIEGVNAKLVTGGKVTGAIKFTAEAGATVKIVGKAGNNNYKAKVWVCKLENDSLVKVVGLGTGMDHNEELSGSIAMAEAELEEAGTFYVVQATNLVSYNLGYIEVTYEDVSGWTEDTTVRVDFNAGDGTSVEHQDIVTGQKCTEPGSILDGFVLEGWYKEATFETKFNFDTDTVSGDMTLYAKWVAEDPSTRTELTLNISDLPTGSFADGFTKNGFTVGKSVSIVAENATLGSGDEAVPYTKALKFGGNGTTKSGTRDFVFNITEPSILTVVAAANDSDGRILKVAKITGEGDSETEETSKDIMVGTTKTISKNEVALADAGKYRIYADKDYKIYYVSVVAGSMLNAPSITPAAGTTALDRDTEIEITHNNATGTLQYAVNDGAFANYTEKIVLGNLVADDVNTVTIKAKVIPAEGDTTNKESAVTTVTYTLKPVGGVTPPVDPDDPDVPDAAEEGKLYVQFVNGYEYTYTGTKIEPAIKVYNNRKLLTLGTDYTVKYKNNINKATETDAKAPAVVISGKGNLSGAAEEIKFTINPAEIDKVAKYPEEMTVAVNAKVSPVIMHGTKKLGNKDYTLEPAEADSSKFAKGKYTEAGEYNLTLKGLNNYDGSSDTIKVKVVAKADLQTLKVTVDKVNKNDFVYGKLDVDDISDFLKEPATSGGESGTATHDDTANTVNTKIINVTDKSGNTLTENTDFVIYSSSSVKDAGTVKFTVVGKGAYSGTVNKSFKINPAKLAKDMFEVTYDKDKDYEFKASGVTVDDLTVKYLGTTPATELVEGKDYKVAYSNNKKVGDKAQIKITFLGNYKGSKVDPTSFTIKQAVLTPQEDGDGNTVVVVPNKTYNKPGKAYKSTPIVTVDGVAIKASNYKVNYSWATASKADNDANYEDGVKVTIAEGDDYAIVKATIELKPNSTYAAATNGTDPVAIVGEYKVAPAGDKAIDLSKAKVEFTDKDGKVIKSVEYSGKAIYELEGDDVVNVKVTPKGASDALSSDLYTVEWTNATEKGKATVVVNGTGTTVNGGDTYAVGSKNASISIKAKSVKKAALPNNKPSAVGVSLQNVLDMIF